jgi:TNF receptor-associated protein 1
VTVFSRSSLPGGIGYCWTSDGTGSYEISEAEGVQRGTKIIIQLNDKSHEFSLRETIDKIVKK